MRWIAWALLLGACLVAKPSRAPETRVIEVSTAQQLMEALREPLKNVTIRLAPNTYAPVPRETPSRFRSGDHVANLSVGVIVSGNGVRIEGPENGQATIAADANYQLFFKNCMECELERVKTSDSGLHEKQYSGAILAENSSVCIANCSIGGASSATHSTIGAIYGRANTELNIESNEIAGHTTAIAIENRGTAIVSGNLLVGRALTYTDGGSGLRVGAGIDAVVERNHMSGFDTGIELRENSSLHCRNNIIENCHDIGIMSDSGWNGRLRIEQNVIYRCGGPGIAVRADGDQIATRNIVVETGLQIPWPSAVFSEGARSDAVVRRNTLHDNTTSVESLDRDVPREMFWRARRKWTRTYRNTPVGIDGRHKFHESAFLTRYGRWAY
jgi:hypothetical protein